MQGRLWGEDVWGGEVLRDATAVRRCRGGVGREAPGARLVQDMAVRRCGVAVWRRSFAGRDGAACGGSGAMRDGAQARASPLHFFTFMGLIFVKYWVIMQM